MRELKPRLSEKLFMFFTPICLIALISYYGYIGFLAFTYEPTDGLDDKTPTTDVLTPPDVVDSTDDALVEKWVGISQFDGLNVRSKRDMYSDKLGQLALGEEVDVLNPVAQDEFIEIMYNEQSAFVHVDYLEIISAADSQASENASSN